MYTIHAVRPSGCLASHSRFSRTSATTRQNTPGSRPLAYLPDTFHITLPTKLWETHTHTKTRPIYSYISLCNALAHVSGPFPRLWFVFNSAQHSYNQVFLFSHVSDSVSVNPWVLFLLVRVAFLCCLLCVRVLFKLVYNSINLLRFHVFHAIL